MPSPTGARTRQFLRVAFINVVVLFGMYALAEIALHLVSPDRNPLFGTALRIPDRVFHHTLRPYFDGYDVWGDQRYRVVTNSLGFKDGAARTVPMAADRRRIVFIGDSFTEGVGQPYEQTFVGRFARTFPDLDVLNAGVVSYAPSAYYEKLKYLIGLGLKFDEVFVYIDISDVRDEAVGYCYDEHAVLRMRNLQSCGYGVCPSGEPAPKVWWKEALKETLYIPNFFYQTLKKRWRISARDPSNDAATVADAAQPGAAYRRNSDVRASWTYDENTPCFGWPGIEGGIRKAREQMDRLYRMLAERGVALSVGVYPWPHQLLYDDEDSRQVKIWREWCGGKCRSFFDHFPAFFRYKREHPDFLKDLFISGDIHYSALGNRVLADSLIEQYRNRAQPANDAEAASNRRGSAQLR
ncbi:MAG TPA: SGNH/GDSL hydrolase family protein [Alphaproteobacteria bacterium]